MKRLTDPFKVLEMFICDIYFLLMHFKDNYQPSTHQNIANELLFTYIDILWFNILDQFSVSFSLFFHSLLLLYMQMCLRLSQDYLDMQKMAVKLF